MGRFDRDVRLVDQSGDVITPGNPLPVTGGGGGGGAVTIADGADVTQGAIADAAVTTDAAGTINAKLRGLVAILSNVWDSGAGKLKVDAGTIGTGQQDKSTFTEGTTNFTPVGGVRNDSLTGDVAEDNAAAARITPKRGLHVNIRADDGTELGGITGPIRIDPTGTTAQPVTDNGGSLSVDDGGGSITVDGTLTASPSGNVLGSQTFTALGQNFDLVVEGYTAIMLDVQSAGYSGRTRALGSVDDGANYDVTLPFYNLSTNLIQTIISFGEVGDFLLNVAGCTHVRFETFNTFTSGSVTFKASAATAGPFLVIPGTLPGGLRGYAVGVGAGTTDIAIPPLYIVRATPTSTAGSPGQYSQAQIDLFGRQWVKQDSTKDQTTSGSIAGNTQQVAIEGLEGHNTVLFRVSGTWTGSLVPYVEVQTSPINYNVRAYDIVNNQWRETITANGLYMVPAGGLATVLLEGAVWSSGTATVEAVASLGDYFVQRRDVDPYGHPSISLSGRTNNITDTSDTQVIAAQGTGVHIYVTQTVIQNSHATVATWVNIKDGTTAIESVYCAAAGGGAALVFPKPLRLAANTALNVACETTGANVRASASGYAGA